MAFLNDYIYDAALAKLDTEGNRLDICSTEPTSYAQAIDRACWRATPRET